jgi:transposase
MPPFYHRHVQDVDVPDRATLERWVRAPTTPQRLVLRSRIVLMLAEGLSAREVARRLGISRHTVDLWRARYSQDGCGVLTHDKPGRGRKPRS